MSKKRLVGIIIGCIIIFIVIAAISTLGLKPVTDYSTLLHYLRTSGVFIREERQTSWFLFYYALWRTVEVDGICIQVLEFASAKDMEADASCVSPDGFEITKDLGDGRTTHRCIGWIDTPHFYKAGRIIVIYVGNNYSMINLLENAFGKQFAGT